MIAAWLITKPKAVPTPCQVVNIASGLADIEVCGTETTVDADRVCLSEELALARLIDAHYRCIHALQERVLKLEGSNV